MHPPLKEMNLANSKGLFSRFLQQSVAVFSSFSSIADLHRTYFAFYYNKKEREFKLLNNLTEVDECDRWSLYNSVFFSFTAMTTIGNGSSV
jgi:hypothetical protein